MERGQWEVANVPTADKLTGLRHEPDQQRGANIITYIAEGTRLRAVSSQLVQGYTYVTLQDLTKGWLRSAYLRMVEPPAANDVGTREPVLLRAECKGSTTAVIGGCSALDNTSGCHASFEVKGVQSCALPWVDGLDMVEVTVKKSSVTISRDSKNLHFATAPYHAYVHMAGALPAFETHTQPMAAACLAEMLPRCGMVALVVQDTAGRYFSEELTVALRCLGATHVPPAFRASWAFLWTPQQAFEAYKLDGVAEVKTEISGRSLELQSAGWHNGNFAQIKIDGVQQLHEPKRGINCCIWGPDLTAMVHSRRFDHEYMLTNYMSQIRSGIHCVVVCTAGALKPFQRHAPHFYEELMRLGGSGQVIGCMDSFMLSGTMRAGPIKKRHKPSSADIEYAMQQQSPRTFDGHVCMSILFGQNPGLCLGALVVSKSLQKHSPHVPRVLLVTRDVPDHHRHVLQQSGWRLIEVPYLNGAYTNFHEHAKLPPEIFTKLHAFNPDVLPYEKVLYLDLDTLVRKDVSALFQQCSPAAVNNWKSSDKQACVNEGQIMDPNMTSFNAGVFLCSPNRAVFELLKEDAERPGVHHHKAWTPEQHYLSTMLTGHLRHLHCKYNFEPQIHGGTCLSRDWQTCAIEDVSIVHFSGKPKPWQMNSHDEVTCVLVNDDSLRQKYRKLDSYRNRQLATLRARVFHDEWLRVFEEIDFLQDPSLDGFDDEQSQGVVPEKRMVAFLAKMDQTISCTEAIVVFNGCFCPVHAGHVKALTDTKRKVEADGKVKVVAGYFAVATDSFVSAKVDGKLAPWMTAAARVEICKAVAEDANWNISAAEFACWKQCGKAMVERYHSAATKIFGVRDEAKKGGVSKKGDGETANLSSTNIRAEFTKRGYKCQVVDDLVSQRVLGRAVGECLKQKFGCPERVNCLE